MRRVVIVGAGHAGGRVAQHLVELGFDGAVTLIGDEAHPPYERPPLSKDYLAGRQTFDGFCLPMVEIKGDSPTALRTIVARVVEVDCLARTVRLQDGDALPYDALVIATGTGARRVPIAGINQPHVHVLRTIGDADRLRDALAGARHLAVIGGGVIGMEVAATASGMGVGVTVIEAGDRIMARCLTPTVSAWLADAHARRGIAIRTECKVTNITEDAVRIETGDGSNASIDADCVLIAAGAVPLMPAFVGDIDVTDGLLVDAHCRVPNFPEIYAVGDVARMPVGAATSRQETWRNAENGARAVAEFLCGREEPYVELPWMWSDQFGDNIQVIGAPITGMAEVQRGDLAADGKASLFYLREGRLAGAILVNEGRNRRPIEKLLHDGMLVDAARLADAAIPLKSLA